MGALVSVTTVLTPKGQGTLPAPSPKPPSLLICTLELGLGLLPQVLSKSGGLSGSGKSLLCLMLWDLGVGLMGSR